MSKVNKMVKEYEEKIQRQKEEAEAAKALKMPSKKNLTKNEKKEQVKEESNLANTNNKQCTLQNESNQQKSALIKEKEQEYNSQQKKQLGNEDEQQLSSEAKKKKLEAALGKPNPQTQAVSAKKYEQEEETFERRNPNDIEPEVGEEEISIQETKKKIQEALKKKNQYQPKEEQEQAEEAPQNQAKNNHELQEQKEDQIGFIMDNRIPDKEKKSLDQFDDL